MKKEIEEIKGMLNKLSDAIHIKTNGNGYNEEVMVRDITIKLNSLNIDSVVKSFVCDAEEKGGSRCETQCLGCDGFKRMDEAN